MTDRPPTLKEALAPFAREADRWDEFSDYDDDQTLDCDDTELTVGDLRRARQALSKGEASELVKRLTELLAKATPGPWKQIPIWLTSDTLDGVEGQTGHVANCEVQADAALVVEMFNALPALLQAADERLQSLKKAFEDAQQARDEVGYLGPVADCIRHLDAELRSTPSVEKLIVEWLRKQAREWSRLALEEDASDREVEKFTSLCVECVRLAEEIENGAHRTAIESREGEQP